MAELARFSSDVVDRPAAAFRLSIGPMSDLLDSSASYCVWASTTISTAPLGYGSGRPAARADSTWAANVSTSVSTPRLSAMPPSIRWRYWAKRVE